MKKKILILLSLIQFLGTFRVAQSQCFFYTSTSKPQTQTSKSTRPVVTFTQRTKTTSTFKPPCQTFKTTRPVVTTTQMTKTTSTFKPPCQAFTTTRPVVTTTQTTKTTSTCKPQTQTSKSTRPVVTTTQMTSKSTTKENNSTFPVSTISSELAYQINSVFNPRNLTQQQMGLLRTLLVGSCWRDSYTRGAGELITECDVLTEEKDGALCYPKCENGYTGVGPVCWEKCKEGYTDRGVFCIIDLYVYSKGCCCIAGGNCCNNCPTNFTDDGCTCRRPPTSYTKKSYGRGAGKPLKCKANYEINGALCYPLCKEGFTGVGPVCWKNCVQPLINDCGALCTISESACAFKSFNLVYFLGVPFKTMLAYLNLANLVNLQSLYELPIEYSVPKCF